MTVRKRSTTSQSENAMPLAVPTRVHVSPIAVFPGIMMGVAVSDMLISATSAAFFVTEGGPTANVPFGIFLMFEGSVPFQPVKSVSRTAAAVSHEKNASVELGIKTQLASLNRMSEEFVGKSGRNHIWLFSLPFDLQLKSAAPGFVVEVEEELLGTAAACPSAKSRKRLETAGVNTGNNKMYIYFSNFA